MQPFNLHFAAPGTKQTEQPFGWAAASALRRLLAYWQAPVTCFIQICWLILSVPNMTFLGQKRAPHPAYTKAGRSATTVRAATSRRAVLPSGSALPVYSGSTFQPTFLLPHKPWCPLMWHWFALQSHCIWFLSMIHGHQGLRSSKAPSRFRHFSVICQRSVQWPSIRCRFWIVIG